jgi:flagellar protein FlgJ
MMLESMRSAGEVFGDGSDTTYRDLFDRQIALEITRGKGLGIADVLARQIAPPAADATVRAPGARDFVNSGTVHSIGQLSELSPNFMPSFTAVTPDHEALLALAALPAFQVAEPPAEGRSWTDWRPATPEDFIRDVWPHAERAGTALGVDPRGIVAQAALETGWGRNVSRDARGVSGNNPFNIKADGRWAGARVSVRTLEFEEGLPRPQVASFRAYPDIGAAFEDYVAFLKGNPRYAEALRNGADAVRFADSLQEAGYATDPRYATKLRSILASPRFNDLVGSLKNAGGLPIY